MPEAHAGRVAAAGGDGVAEKHDADLAQRRPRHVVSGSEGGQRRKCGGEGQA